MTPSYETFDVYNYGLIFIFENGTQGAYAIYGVIGNTLTPIASKKYGDVEVFTVSKSSGGVLTITNTLDRITKHGVLSFGGN